MKGPRRYSILFGTKLNVTIPPMVGFFFKRQKYVDQSKHLRKTFNNFVKNPNIS